MPSSISGLKVKISKFKVEIPCLNLNFRVRKVKISGLIIKIGSLW